MNYSDGLAKAMRDYLDKKDMLYEFNDQLGRFRFRMSLTGRIKDISYIIWVKSNLYLVYAIAPLGADPEDQKAMAEMAEFICRANYGLNIGNFEMDFYDGEIRFKICVDCDNTTPTSEILCNSIFCPAAMYEIYGSGILDVIIGKRSPKEAVEKCEEAADDNPGDFSDEPQEDDRDFTDDSDKTIKLT